MIALSNGVAIQALDLDMSVTRWNTSTPGRTRCWSMTVEDPEEVRSDVERLGTWDWLLKTLLLSLDHSLGVWIRALGTRRGTGPRPELDWLPYVAAARLAEDVSAELEGL